MNIEESIRELKGYLIWLEANGFSKLAKDSAIETLLTAYEKEKEKNKELEKKLEEINDINFPTINQRRNKTMSDEEKKALERIDYIQDFIIENGQYNADVNDMEYFSKILNLIEKQTIEVLRSLLEKE